MIYVKELSRFANTVQQFIESEINHQNKSDPKFRVSEFWKEEFSKRKNFPGINELQTFLRVENKFLKGMGVGRNGAFQEQQDWFLNVCHMIYQFVPEQFITSLKEPIFGSPRAFQYKNINNSAAFVMNTGTCYRCMVQAKQLLPEKRLRVCEIGPGWGALAQQLHQVLDIENYLICDLPQNLYLASIYLSQTLQDRKILFVGSSNSERVIDPNDKTLYISLPHGISKVDYKFDFIVNSFSLQEMDSNSAKAYIEWIYNSLKEDGIFISFNSHNKAGIRKASEYGFEKFCIRSLKPFRKTPSQFTNTIPYEVVLSRRVRQTPTYESKHLDVLCELMQIGLDRDIEYLCEKFVAGNLTPEDETYLELIADFYYSQNHNQKLKTLDKMSSFKDRQVITEYIKGCYLFASGFDYDAINSFKFSIRNNIKDFARTRSIATVFCVQSVRGISIDEDIKAYLKEVRSLSPNLVSFIEELGDRKKLKLLRANTAKKLLLEASNWQLSSQIKSIVKQLIPLYKA